MLRLRAAWRFAWLIWYVACGLALCALVIQPALWLNPQRNHWRVRMPIVRWWFRRIAASMSLRIHAHGQPTQETVLFVANHITWLDIITLGCLLPANFVAKQEVRQWPVLGWMCAVAGTLFVRRGDLDSAHAALALLQQHLFAGKSIVVFPEGTSTDGSRVCPFKRRLFQPAVVPERGRNAACLVQAIALAYPHAGKPSAVIPFIGNDTLLTNLLRIVGQREIVVEVYFQPVQAPAPDQDARAVSSQAWTYVDGQIRQRWALPPIDA